MISVGGGSGSGAGLVVAHAGPEYAEYVVFRPEVLNERTS